MLSVVLATPRSGSNSFVDSLDIGIWMPADHPGYKSHHELYNFSHCSTAAAHRNVLKYHTQLLDHIRSHPRDSVLVKVLVGQVQGNILDDLLVRADQIHHTLRLNHTEQLKSFIHASSQDVWMNNRRPQQNYLVTQSQINQAHALLCNLLETHGQLYFQHGGFLHVLEGRAQQPYQNKPEYPEDLIWPAFDTAAVFGIDPGKYQ